jgi:hypothetical protein
MTCTLVPNATLINLSCPAFGATNVPAATPSTCAVALGAVLARTAHPTLFQARSRAPNVT